MNDILKALEEAAQSLAAISEQAGRSEYMDDMIGVRAYAASRALVARAKLEREQRKRDHEQRQRDAIHSRISMANAINLE